MIIIIYYQYTANLFQGWVIEMCPITEVVLSLRWSYHWGGPISDRWSYHWCGPITEVVLSLRWSYHWGGPITEVVLSLRLPYYRGVPITEVFLLQRWSYHWGGPIAELVILMAFTVLNYTIPLCIVWFSLPLHHRWPGQSILRLLRLFIEFVLSLNSNWLIHWMN